MALDRGIKPSKEEFLNGHWKNLHRLWIWLMIGADIKNGIWAIYGAREGLYKTMCTEWDYVNVRDFEHLNNLWKEKETMTNEDMRTHNTFLGEKLIDLLEVPIGIRPLDETQSKFFKTVYQNPSRNSSEQFVIDIE